jgi:protein tyrosine phosphatase (PTP) superfamily phosphohydrolase (DUF442 family)
VIALWLILAIAGLIAGGNLAILVAHHWIRRRHPPGPALELPVPNGYRVTESLWRCGGPDGSGYRALAAAGVDLLVDLRAEGGEAPDSALALPRIVLPVTNDLAPPPDVVERLREAIAAATGPVLVHCSAGVGRTGAAVAAVRVRDHGLGPLTALRELFAVGLPSLEQIVFVLRLSGGVRRTPKLVAALSRLLDSPRLAWGWIRDQTRRPDPREIE